MFKTSLRKYVASIFVAMSFVLGRRLALDGQTYTFRKFVETYGWDDGEMFWDASGATQAAAAIT